eukprot:TRINITY_DN16113_c0_g1_i2.p1 TRINITY_DN16113_c0_g1~~TRINITY_DN16113_c0_g1_i2.p1  ORF type:complete len:270 (+),score=10.91 TRINITY_DN16113_c0_g1_i2:72-881(+)
MRGWVLMLCALVSRASAQQHQITVPVSQIHQAISVRGRCGPSQPAPCHFRYPRRVRRAYNTAYGVALGIANPDGRFQPASQVTSRIHRHGRIRFEATVPTGDLFVGAMAQATNMSADRFRSSVAKVNALMPNPVTLPDVVTIHAAITLTDTPDESSSSPDHVLIFVLCAVGVSFLLACGLGCCLTRPSRKRAFSQSQESPQRAATSACSPPPYRQGSMSGGGYDAPPEYNNCSQEELRTVRVELEAPSMGRDYVVNPVGTAGNPQVVCL